MDIKHPASMMSSKMSRGLQTDPGTFHEAIYNSFDAIDAGKIANYCVWKVLEYFIQKCQAYARTRTGRSARTPLPSHAERYSYPHNKLW